MLGQGKRDVQLRPRLVALSRPGESFWLAQLQLKIRPIRVCGGQASHSELEKFKVGTEG